MAFQRAPFDSALKSDTAPYGFVPVYPTFVTGGSH
jgi:hypothetical protein